jgi:hypothetical protein
MRKNRQVFSKGRFHIRERYERQKTILRCKACAQHTDILCSGCHTPICMRHKWSPDGVKLFCWECFPATTNASSIKSTLPNGHRSLNPRGKVFL